jgi:hypothetical protein
VWLKLELCNAFPKEFPSSLFQKHGYDSFESLESMWPVLLRNVTDAPSFAHQLQTVFFDHEPKTLHSVLYTNDGIAQETSLDLDDLIQWTRGLLTRPERIKKDRIHTRKVSKQVLTTRKT